MLGWFENEAENCERSYVSADLKRLFQAIVDIEKEEKETQTGGAVRESRELLTILHSYYIRGNRRFQDERKISQALGISKRAVDRSGK